MIVQQSPRVVSKKVGSQWIILETNKKYIRELNQTAGIIWRMAKTPVSIDKIISQISKEYETTQQDVTKDVCDFVEQYIRSGLLVQIRK